METLPVSYPYDDGLMKDCFQTMMAKQEFIDGIDCGNDDDAKTQIMDGFDGESFDDDWRATEAAAIARDSHIQQTMAELGVSTKHEVYEQARRVIGVALVASVVASPEVEEGIAVPPLNIHVEEEFAIPESDSMPCPCEIDEALDQIEAIEAEFEADAEAAFPVQLLGPPARRPQMSSEASSDAEALNGPLIERYKASPADVSVRRRAYRRPRTPTRSPERRGKVSGRRVPSRRPPPRPDQRGRATSPSRARACSPVQ